MSLTDEPQVKRRRLSFRGFSLLVREGWHDVTDEFEGPDVPYTISNTDLDIGVLQFSCALYRGGKVPNATTETLCDFLDDFAAKQRWKNGFERQIYSGTNLLVGESFCDGSYFVRVWYISDGSNFILATYVSQWDLRHIEREEREMIVASIRFEPRTSRRRKTGP
jgi:hypothetical protein